MIDLVQKRVFKTKYQILPGRPSKDFLQWELHNKAYLFWKAFWEKIYGDADALSSFSYDDFSRQDFIPVITYNDEIVGMHLYTVFDARLESARDHHYFKFYPPEFFNYLIENRAPHIMSLEYLTIEPAWRKSKTGVSLAECLIACGINQMEHVGVDAVIGPARTTNKVHSMCYDLGFDCYQSDLTTRNFKVDIVVGYNGKADSSLKEDLNPIIDHLWSNRIDYTNQNTNKDILRTA